MGNVTLGGVAVGICGIIWMLARWWFKEKHQAAALVPYLLSIAYGILAVITGGGALYFAAGTMLWGANGLGDLSLVYGVGGSTGNAGTAHQQALTQGGYVVVLCLTVLLACVAKWSDKLPRAKFLVGSGTGVCLGLSSAFASVAAVPLVSAVNALGTPLTAAFQ